MNPHQKMLRRWLAIAWLASGVFLSLDSYVCAKPDGQTTLAPGYLIVVDDKLYVADLMYRGIVQPLSITCHETRLVLTDSDNRQRIVAGFQVDANGQLSLTKEVKAEIKLKRRMLEDTRNPKLDAKDLQASSYRYLYALQAEAVERDATAAAAVVIAEEAVDVTLIPGQKISVRPVLLRVLRIGDAYLKFEVNYTSGK